MGFSFAKGQIVTEILWCLAIFITLVGFGLSLNAEYEKQADSYRFSKGKVYGKFKK